MGENDFSSMPPLAGCSLPARHCVIKYGPGLLNKHDFSPSNRSVYCMYLGASMLMHE